MFGMPRKGEIDYSVDIDLDLADVQPSVAGPKEAAGPDQFAGAWEKHFAQLLEKPVAGWRLRQTERRSSRKTSRGIERQRASRRRDGFDRYKEDQGINPGDELNKIEMVANRPTPDPAKKLKLNPATCLRMGRAHIGHGSVLIAAITSCTNTSNPSVMIAAGLLAKKAVERGLRVDPAVKTSLAPGSRVVSDYLDKTGLQKYLDQLGFNLVGYGCTTCIGNSGPLHPNIEKAIHEFDLVAASVLSGNRNFEARVHQHIKANFLMSPPLVVAFALAGRVHIDLSREPLGKDKHGKETFLRDLWPSLSEIRDTMQSRSRAGNVPQTLSRFRRSKSEVERNSIEHGRHLPVGREERLHSRAAVFQEFLDGAGHIEEIRGARALGIFGDSVTTDHISPAGAIKATSPAGQYLISRGIEPR
mgnify:CR=1 FL=1